ncbi:hypothetical protein CMQ_2693 [Grosmannia clavigera kw1407]|uniref:Extracellular mutant protein 11 C-terminal domain-containing protein n=1 Tax=Grosmannia clavigera (strain kw1407 / UAMH 11150) TaxID=655863 RepID=F0XGU3_GROCL|nr:uncharacterized protein CMQ_2693 [Grosmannia clavigera kw1407]EFX02764.1 hypothetical protein CMQ_2693 [Grosmannia clavigera kw1407]
MLRYMQSSDPNGDDNGGLDESPETSPQLAAQQPTQPPLPLSTRQQLAEAAMIPVPVPVRSATIGHQASALPTGAAPKQQQQAQRQSSLRRTRSPPPSSSEQTQQQIWEESSINSMFAESIPATARKQRVSRGRYEDIVQQQRMQQRFEHLADEPTGPLVGDRGGLRNAAGDAPDRTDDPHERPPYGSPTRQAPYLKHPRQPLRDGRVATGRPSFVDRPSGGNYEDVKGGSPERRLRQGRDSKSKAVGGGSMAPEAGLREPVYFREAEMPLARTPGKAARSEDESDGLSPDDEATTQQTPRQHYSPPRRPPPLPPSGVPLTRGLLESSVPRTAGGGGSRRDKKTGRKRRNSLDYDDSMLHRMSYSDLRVEPFDHDPTRVAVKQAATTPPKLSLEERLVQHKRKDGTSQHIFFTEMSMKEWDECGDWFLTQFSELSNRIREKRQAKRKKVAEFETEIAEREEMVRDKMESIDRTLDTLKLEGEGMMRGKAAGV